MWENNIQLAWFGHMSTSESWGAGPMDERPLRLCSEGWVVPKRKWICFCQEKGAEKLNIDTEQIERKKCPPS